MDSTPTPQWGDMVDDNNESLPPLERIAEDSDDVENEKAQTVNKLEETANKLEETANKLEELTEKLDNVAGKVISLTCIVKHLQRKHAEQNEINDYLARLYTKTSYGCYTAVCIWAGIMVSPLAYIRKH
jgi:uncharacterized coiled-coil DUF342 family protein